MAPDCKSGEVSSTQVRILLCPYVEIWISKKKNKRDIYTAGVAQLVEHQPSKLNVVGSSPITRSVIDGGPRCCRSVVVARRLGKAQVVGSIPTGSSLVYERSSPGSQTTCWDHML